MHGACETCSGQGYTDDGDCADCNGRGWKLKDGTFTDENGVRRESAGGEPVNPFVPGKAAQCETCGRLKTGPSAGCLCGWRTAEASPDEKP